MRRLFPAIHPDLDWIQVGITTQCNASCAYCPRSTWSSLWRSGHMDPEIFYLFLSRLKKVKLIYLQGWGEPFLHPDFWNMLEGVKQKGFMAGCTSNANLLDSETLRRTVDSGLDVLALSLAGLDRKNDQARRGTSYKRVMSVIEELNRVKELLGSHTPDIHLAYMLLRSHLEEDLPKLPGVFLDAGVDYVVLSSLTLPLTAEMESEALLADSRQGYEELRSRLTELFSGSELSSRVFGHIYNPYLDPGKCTENVERALCLSEEGAVTPCIYTQVPVQAGATHRFRGDDYELQHAEFGNIKNLELKEIWHREEYKRFRKNLDLAMCFRCTKTRIEDVLH